jgi:2-polyprenyl-3-methyl-5-hydroxy-6-metoxy-1,4-benzoquinol methylase
MYPNPFPVPADPEQLYGAPTEYFAGHTHEEKIEIASDILRGIKKRLPYPPKVLDIGSGCGEFLLTARNQGIDAVGLELSDAMIRYGAEKFGVEIHKLSAEAAADQWPGSFDAVVMSSVLEHVHDPDALIRSVNRLLRASGIVYIEVPNEPCLLTEVGNFAAKAMGRKHVFNLSPTWPPYHVYGFNPRSLKKILEKHDLKIEELKIWADPKTTARKEIIDQLKSKIAYGINHVANLTGTASNLHLWARKAESRL